MQQIIQIIFELKYSIKTRHPHGIDGVHKKRDSEIRGESQLIIIGFRCLCHMGLAGPSDDDDVAVKVDSTQ
jgi:hypothetical protein